MTMARYRTMLELLLGVGILFKGCDSDVKCRNDDGNEVDWYILYKLPKVKSNGLCYLYMDESTNGWQVSKKQISSTSGALANTLKPLLDFYDRKTEGFGYMLYNDQPPDPPGPKSVSASYGHSKGVVMLDRRTGVWLSHSTPRFPKYRNKNFWPDSGSVNGQTFMCVTYSYNTFKDIGLQLKYIHPYPYDSDIPTTFPNELRCVEQRNQCFPKKEPWFRVQALTSWNGRKFTSFAKYTRFGDDLYSGLIVNSLKNNLYVKSWGKMRTAGPLPSNCSSSIPHIVYNVETIKIPKPKKSFNNTLDHSKWCVTPDGDWTCIADTNREQSQMKRGGGAICIEKRTAANTFSSMVDSYEQCEPAPRRLRAQTREL
uniref:Deoxyribonuclease-2-alpha n=1 Tax=Gasterosteus aculeatus aculeatus TaxID=481459 RepID=G3P596_GASAC|nr:deoxyribonuclease-2-alpha-like [Gasterosteus aculeatus aculeatus]